MEEINNYILSTCTSINLNINKLTLNNLNVFTVYIYISYIKKKKLIPLNVTRNFIIIILKMDDDNTIFTKHLTGQYS